MSDEAAFRRAILDNVNDDAPRPDLRRLVRGAGRPAPEFIRLGCEANTILSTCGPENKWTSRSAGWRSGTRPPGSARWPKWASSPAGVASWRRCDFRMWPASGDSPSGPTPSCRRRWSCCSSVTLWSPIQYMPTYGPGDIDPAVAPASAPLAASPLAGQLRRLDLMGVTVGPDVAHAVADSPAWAGLTHLDFSRAQIGVSGLVAILESQHLRRITTLNVCGVLGWPRHGPAMANVGRRGITYLAGTPRSLRLRVLDLSWNQLDEATSIELAESPYLGNLEQFELSHCELSQVTRERLKSRFGDRLFVAWRNEPAGWPVRAQFL